jgi:adenine nucleotide transporter 17
MVTSSNAEQNSSSMNIFLASLGVCLILWVYHTRLSFQTTHISDDILHAISGSIASAFSISLFYPLETIRTRLQVDYSENKNTRSSLRLIYDIATNKKVGGIPSLYRGWASLVLALMCLNFVYFYCFRATRRWLEQSIVDSGKYKVIIDLIAGYAAGVVGVLLTAPLWLANTRLKLQGLNLGVDNNKQNDKPSNKEAIKKYSGIIHCLLTTYKEEGWQTLWNGTITSIVLSLNPAIQLGVYELLKRHHSVATLVSNITPVIFVRTDETRADDNAIDPFVNALLAKFLATIITYPIQVVQTRHRAVRTAPGTTQHENHGWIQDIRNIIRQHGVSGLFRGLESKLLQTCLNSAFMFLMYENLVEVLRSLLVDET